MFTVYEYYVQIQEYTDWNGAMEELRRRKGEISPLIEQEDSVVNDEEIKDEMEELWDNNDILVQAHAGQKPYNERFKVLRRTTEEVTLAFVIHLIFLVYYIAIHVYDATVFKKCKDPNLVFVGYDTFGGRYKYFTYLTMWGLFIYFFLAFFTDIMPHSAAKVMFHKCTDWLFTTAVWPASWTLVIFFWVLSAVDIHLIGCTEEMIKHLPVLLDHAQHTFPLLIVIVEALLVYHRYPSNLNAAFSVFSFSTAYIIWILIVYTKLKIWVYPFMNYLNPFTFIVFAAATFCWSGLMYIIGKRLAYWRWKERFLVLYEMAELEEDNN